MGSLYTLCTLLFSTLGPVVPERDQGWNLVLVIMENKYFSSLSPLCIFTKTLRQWALSNDTYRLVSTSTRQWWFYTTCSVLLAHKFKFSNPYIFNMVSIEIFIEWNSRKWTNKIWSVSFKIFANFHAFSTRIFRISEIFVKFLCA